MLFQDILLHDFFRFLFLLVPLDVGQNYETRVGDEFVILGNDALVKCGVPSFAADYLQVIGWVIDEDLEILTTSNINGTP